MPSNLRRFFQLAFDFGFKIVWYCDLLASLLLQLLFHFLKRFKQSVAGDEHLIGLSQRLTVGDHLADFVLPKLAFDEIDQLPRCHGVQLDPLGAQEVDRVFIETGLAQSFIADAIRAGAPQFGLPEDNVKELRRGR